MDSQLKVREGCSKCQIYNGNLFRGVPLTNQWCTNHFNYLKVMILRQSVRSNYSYTIIIVALCMLISCKPYK